MIPLTVHAPNLAHRTDRRAHLKAQFAGKPEFRLIVESVVPNAVPSLSLWFTFQRIVRQERDAGSDLFIFCEDDHQFTPDYSWPFLQAAIAEADRLGADVLSGGVSWSGDAVQCSDHLFWLKGFNGMQFTVVFRRFYDALLQDHPKVSFVTDIRLSELSDNIFVTYPYLSVQREFGYSDVTPCNNPRGHVDWLFRTTREKFRILNKVRSYYQTL